MADVFTSLMEMARSRDADERQVHPTGAMVTVDDSVKRRVRAELDQRGWSQADLARALNVSPATVTNFFKPGDRQNRIYPRLVKLFGWVDTSAPATATPVDVALRRVQRKWTDLTETDRATVAALVDSLAKR